MDVATTSPPASGSTARASRVRERVTGLDYWKNPVDERFEIVRGMASWSNVPEKGEKKVSGAAFYIARSISNIDLGLLATALLRSPRRSCRCSPRGRPRSKASARPGSGRGRRRGISRSTPSPGLGLSPFYIWMEDARTFFGRYDGYITAVPEGWEDVAPEMIKAQAQRVAARQKAEAAKLEPPAARGRW